MSEGQRGKQGEPGIQGQHGAPGVTGQHGEPGVTGPQGATGSRGAQGRSGFDWTPLAAYVLLAAAFIFTARENRIQTGDIIKQRAVFETCVNNLRKDLRMVIRDFQRADGDQTVYVRAQARLENQEC